MSILWAKADHCGASDWAASLPPGEVRENALYAITKTLLVAEQASVFRLLKSLPDDSDRDAVLIPIIQRLSHEAPELVAELIPQMKNKEWRDSFLIPFALSWLQSDRAAAGQWLEKLNISTETRQRIQERQMKQK